MRDELATDKVINRVGEVDRHSDGSIVENRNKQLQVKACAMAITATTTTGQEIAPRAPVTWDKDQGAPRRASQRLRKASQTLRKT